MFWKVFYTLAAVSGLFYSIMYFAEVLPADNVTLGMYCLGWAFMCAGEAIRRKDEIYETVD